MEEDVTSAADAFRAARAKAKCGRGHGHGHHHGHHGHGHAGAGAGAGGATGGGAGQGGTAGGSTIPPECTGIRSNFACAVEGLLCESLPCGLSDVGRRTCACGSGIWMCTACDFSAGPPEIVDPPTSPLEPCAPEAEDGLACADAGARCQSALPDEVCACWPDAEGVAVWDCDRPPWQ